MKISETIKRFFDYTDSELSCLVKVYSESDAFSETEKAELAYYLAETAYPWIN